MKSFVKLGKRDLSFLWRVCVGLRLSPLFDNIEFDNIFIPLFKKNPNKNRFLTELRIHPNTSQGSGSSSVLNSL